MTIAQLFDPIPVADQQFLLASHLPQGRFWAKAFDADAEAWFFKKKGALIKKRISKAQ